MNSPSPASTGQSRRSTRLAWLLVGAWLAGTSAALWSFEARDARLHETGLMSATAFRGLAHAAENWFAAHPGQRSGVSRPGATVVRVIIPGCRCNTGNDRHLRAIRAAFEPSGVAFATIDAAVLRADPVLRALGSAPTALVFDERGRLAYLGPFSDDAECGGDAGFVERTLRQIARGERPEPQPILARGCYCGTDASQLELRT